MKPIPYGRHTVNQDDINAVNKVLRSNFLTQGPVIDAFEKSISDYCSVKYSLAVNSATSALHLSCLALGVSKLDTVWTSAVTFVATANSAIYCGAKVDFIDIDLKTYNLSIDYLEKKLIAAKKSGTLPKVVIPVHFSGQSCDMKMIHKLALEYGFKVIEDASHAIGGKYKNKLIGNSKYSDITVFSFHAVKIITTGEGGMALTNNKDLFEKMKLLRSHGISRKLSDINSSIGKNWYYEQIDLGFNYRMTDIQAALGLSQLKRIDKFVEKRNKIALSYDNLLEKIKVIKPYISLDNYSSFHLYVIRVPKKNRRNKIFSYLRSHGIQVNFHYIPVYRHPYYRKMGFHFSNFPNSELYYSQAITLPIYPDLKKNEQKKITEILIRSLEQID